MPAQLLTAQTPALADVLPGLTEEQLKTLRSQGELSRTVTGGLVELAPAFARSIRDDNAAIDPTIGIEVLFLVPGTQDIDADLITRLQAISTMEGIEYYSASRERMRILFVESWVVDDESSRERLDDPVLSAVPEQDTLFIRQRDSSFGVNYSRLDYSVSNEGVRLRMTNLDSMAYRNIVPAVAAEQLQLNIVLVPVAEGTLFYGSSAARPISLLGMQDRVQRSFYNRLVALHGWYVDGTNS